MIAESSPIPWFSTARRRTRRIVVVAYWVVAVVLLGIMQWAEAFRPGRQFGLSLLFPLYVLTFLLAILGGVRVGGMVKPFRGARWVPLTDRDEMQTLFGPRRRLMGSMTAADLDLDERDLRERDRAHFLAYTVSRWFAFFLLLVQCMAGFAGSVWLLRAGNAAFLLLAMVLWSLPQTIILWTEPDMEEQQ